MVGRVVDPLLVDDGDPGDAAQPQQAPKVLRRARHPRHVEREHRAGLSVGDRAGHIAEPTPPVGRRRTARLVLVDDLDRLRRPAQGERALPEVVLHHRRLLMVQHLRHRGLPHVHERPSGQLRRLELSFHRRPRVCRPPRRPARGGPACPTRGGSSPARWGTAAPSVGAASPFSFRASASTASSFSDASRRLIRAPTQAASSRSAPGAKRTGRPCTVSAAGRGARSVHAIGRSLSWPSGCSTRSAWRP